MTHKRKCIAATAILFTAIANGCGGGGLESEDFGDCIEVAAEDGVHVECPGDENEAVTVRSTQQAYLKRPCKQAIYGGCVPDVEINIK
jgi:hypothetical protein